MIFVRSNRDASALGPEIRQAIREIAPAFPVYDMQTMSSRAASATAQARFSAVLLALFAISALSLAAIGKTLEESAIILTLSSSTVRFHLRNACRKLGAANRMQAVTKAAYLGLLGPIY
jgi:DNA-binding CsgD family transcriptional regulator